MEQADSYQGDTAKQRIKTEFWNKRYWEARIFILGVNTMNMTYQMSALMNPWTPEHLLMNKIYLASSMAQYLFVLASLKFKKYSSMSLCMIVSVVALLDE